MPPGYTRGTDDILRISKVGLQWLPAGSEVEEFKGVICTLQDPDRVEGLSFTLQSYQSVREQKGLWFTAEECAVRAFEGMTKTGAPLKKQKQDSLVFPFLFYPGYKSVGGCQSHSSLSSK